MPQFDFQHVFWPQLILLAIFFVILYFGIVQLTLPKLGKVIDARENQVSGDLATAETAKSQADRLKADYDSDVAAAQETARARLAQARAEAASAMEARLAASTAALDAKAVAANQSIEAARSSALAEIEGVSAEAAAAIVEKLTGIRPDAAAAQFAARAALG